MAKLSDVYRQPQAVAFLGDICENPDDDAPRLIFADWLEDHGAEERAEFIRSQIERERLPTWSLRYRQLLGREKELQDKGRMAWLDELRELRDICCDHTFRRGFVEKITIRPEGYLYWTKELFRRIPLRSLKFFDIVTSAVSVQDLAAEPHLKRLRELSLSNSNLGEEYLPALIGALESERLEELDLYWSGVGEQSLTALRTARLPNLRRLGLATNSLGRTALRTLFAAPLPFTLHELILGNNALRPTDLLPLWDWPGLASLQSLALPVNDFAPGRAGVIAAMGRLGTLVRQGTLTELYLAKCDLVDDAIAALGGAGLGALTTLDLGDNRIGSTGLQRLLKRVSPGLVELRLHRCELGDEGASVLAAWPGLASVAVLDLTQNDLNESAFVALFTSSHLGELVELNVCTNNPGAAGMQALAGSPKLSQLHALDLNYCRLGDRRVEPLLTSPYLGNLRDLKLHDNPIRKPMKAKLKARFSHGSS